MAKKRGVKIFVGITDLEAGLDGVDTFVVRFPMVVEALDEEGDDFVEKTIRNEEELAEWADAHYEEWEIREG